MKRTDNAYHGFLKPSGNYRSLRVYKLAVIIYDITYFFANTRFSRSDRTIDQMVQAARSGKQNIVEGKEASTTSKEMEIKLTNVAKASLEELLEDYRDYLRVHNLPLWKSDYDRSIKMRQYVKSPAFEHDYMTLANKLNDEEICNLCIMLIDSSARMLRGLMEWQQAQFVKYGGIREQMSRVRRAALREAYGTNKSVQQPKQAQQLIQFTQPQSDRLNQPEEASEPPKKSENNRIKQFLSHLKKS